LYGEVRKKRFQRMNKRFFDILRTIDPATGLFCARIGFQLRETGKTQSGIALYCGYAH
jgi:hypothetical protein